VTRRFPRGIGRLLRLALLGNSRRIASELSTLWKIQVLLRILPNETSRVFAATLAMGALCGLVAVAFHGSLQWSTNRVAQFLASLPAAARMLGIVVLPGIAAWIAGVVLVRSRLPAAGSGIPQVKALMADRIPVFGLRVGAMKLVLSVIQIAGGGSLGREGPTVQICASMVPRMLRVFALPKGMLTRFLPVASAAGIAAAFNTPVAAVTFVMEEFMGSSTSTAMTGLVVAAAIAAIEEKLLLGGQPLFHVPPWSFDSLASLPSFLVLGILGGLLGVLFHRGLLSLRSWIRGLTRFTSPFRMALGGVFSGFAALLAWKLLGSEGIAGPGYALLDGSLNETLNFTQSAGLLPLKFLATLASYSSGGVGGIFSPVLAIGSLLGGAVGWLQRGFPWADTTPIGAFALVGMGTFFAAVIRAPITSVLIIFELTGNYGLILPLMLANMAAFLISKRMNPVPIYEALLLQDGIEPHPDTKDKWPTVGALCRRDIPTVQTDASIQDLVELDPATPCAVLDRDGTLLGLLQPHRDIASHRGKAGECIQTSARLREDDLALPALSLMAQERHRWLPVIDRSGRLAGAFGTHEALAALSTMDGRKRD